MTDPAAPPTPPGVALPQLDPAMIVARVQASSELGAALVQAARGWLYAEHFAAENTELRQQQASHDNDAGGEPESARSK